MMIQNKLIIAQHNKLTLMHHNKLILEPNWESHGSTERQTR